MKQVKIKKGLTKLDVFEIYENLLKAIKVFSGKKILYAINRNINYLKPIIKAMQQVTIIPKSDEFMKYEKELTEGYEKLATQPDGTIKKISDPTGERLDINYYSLEAQELRNTLEKKYRKAIEDRKKDLKEFDEFLNDEFSEQLNLFYIPEGWIDENIKGVDYELIGAIIKPITEEIEKRLNDIMNEISSL